MLKGKTLRDIAVTTLALATAYGLGILSCVWWELKLMADIHKETKHHDEKEEIH